MADCGETLPPAPRQTPGITHCSEAREPNLLNSATGSRPAGKAATAVTDRPLCVFKFIPPAEQHHDYHFHIPRVRALIQSPSVYIYANEIARFIDQYKLQYVIENEENAERLKYGASLSAGALLKKLLHSLMMNSDTTRRWSSKLVESDIMLQASFCQMADKRFVAEHASYEVSWRKLERANWHAGNDPAKVAMLNIHRNRPAKPCSLEQCADRVLKLARLFKLSQKVVAPYSVKENELRSFTVYIDSLNNRYNDYVKSKVKQANIHVPDVNDFVIRIVDNIDNAGDSLRQHALLYTFGKKTRLNQILFPALYAFCYPLCVTHALQGTWSKTAAPDSLPPLLQMPKPVRKRIAEHCRSKSVRQYINARSNLLYATISTDVELQFWQYMGETLPHSRPLNGYKRKYVPVDSALTEQKQKSNKKSKAAERNNHPDRSTKNSRSYMPLNLSFDDVVYIRTCQQLETLTETLLTLAKKMRKKRKACPDSTENDFQVLVGVSCEFDHLQFFDAHVSLLQVDIDAENVFIIDVDAVQNKLDRKMWRNFSHALFTEPIFRKIMLSTDEQLNMLSRAVSGFISVENTSADFEKFNIVDLADVYKNRMLNWNCDAVRSQKIDLPALTRTVLHAELDQTERYSCWRRRPLRMMQVIYGALNAHVLVLLYQRLQKNLQRENVELPQTKPKIAAETSTSLPAPRMSGDAEKADFGRRDGSSHKRRKPSDTEGSDDEVEVIEIAKRKSS